MSDRPIIFSAPMVRALLDGRKTQTRRVLRPQPEYRGGSGGRHEAESWGWEDDCGDHVAVLDIAPNRFRKGDRIWVREAWACLGKMMCNEGQFSAGGYSGPASLIAYKAAFSLDGMDDGRGWKRGQARHLDGHPYAGPSRWRSPIYMPRWASRLTLTVTDVRVQRVQEISEADAVAEGLRGNAGGPWGCEGLIEDFADLWNAIHGPDAWARNDWVAVLTFDVEARNIDAVAAS